MTNYNMINYDTVCTFIIISRDNYTSNMVIDFSVYRSFKINQVHVSHSALFSLLYIMFIKVNDIFMILLR